MKRLARWLKLKWLQFKYRKHDKDVCCCGGYVSKCNPWYCGATGKSMVDHCIDLEMGE